MDICGRVLMKNETWKIEDCSLEGLFDNWEQNASAYLEANERKKLVTFWITNIWL